MERADLETSKSNEQKAPEYVTSNTDRLQELSNLPLEILKLLDATRKVETPACIHNFEFVTSNLIPNSLLQISNLFVCSHCGVRKLAVFAIDSLITSPPIPENHEHCWHRVKVKDLGYIHHVGVDQCCQCGETKEYRIAELVLAGYEDIPDGRDHGPYTIYPRGDENA